ncbi:hypothetical protein LCGC14_1405210 [marine sediment metagenome]|uniref:Uncharacterized protein n=1 Tax=marine sediment metagenome TaxID=412755 RepID=A0A0F9JW77_9ZZZZ
MITRVVVKQRRTLLLGHWVLLKKRLTWLTHCLEKEIAKLEESDSEEEIKKKLKGLGYIS